MILFSKKNLTYAAVAIVVLGAAAYFMMGSNSKDTAVVTAVGAPGSEAEATFLGLASELETVNFSGAIFKDSRFLFLKDIHTNVINEPSGRRDPFAPLAGITASP